MPSKKMIYDIKRQNERRQLMNKSISLLSWCLFLIAIFIVFKVGIQEVQASAYLYLVITLCIVAIILRFFVIYLPYKRTTGRSK